MYNETQKYQRKRFRSAFLLLAFAVLLAAVFASRNKVQYSPTWPSTQSLEQIWQRVFATTVRSPIQLTDLSGGFKGHSMMLLPAGSINQIQMPYLSYWTATLRTVDGDPRRASVILPVYPASNDSRLALLYVPEHLHGTYELVVRIPRPLPGDDDPYEIDPSDCLIYWISDESQMHPPYLDSKVWLKLRKFCCIEQSEPWEWTKSVEYGGGRNQVPVEPYNRTVVFRARVSVTKDTERPSAASVDQILADLRSWVYGSASSNVPKQSLGYWQSYHSPSNSLGSTHYLPLVGQCPVSDEAALKHPECAENRAMSSLRWTPFGSRREDWLLRPQQLKTCLRKKKVRIYGDSLGLGLNRGLTCFLSGYAGLAEGIDWDLQHYRLAVGISPFFAPRMAGVDEIDLEDGAKLLGIDDATSRPDIEIWLAWMWQISYVPSSEWVRGIDRMLRTIKALANERGVTAYIAMATSPQNDPKPGDAVAWQTSDRSYQWNTIMQSAARRHDLPLIDTFWPTVHR